MKSPIKILMVLSLWCLTSVSCSNSSLSVEETKWKCQTENSIPICNVEFKLENSSQLPVSATVVIRAHRRRGSADGAIINDVVAEKKLSLVMEPGEIKKFQEVLEGVGRVTQIVVSAYGEEN